MATRSNILVVNGNEVQQYYHHWDGYLSGVGEELRTIINSVFNNDSFYDSFINELSNDDSYEKESLMSINDVNKLHGDIEFLYIIVGRCLYYAHEWGICNKYNTNGDLINHVCLASNKVNLESVLTD